MAKLVEEWWQEPGEGDQAIEANHLEFWNDFITNAIDVDFSEKKILDFGCNRGGLLRHIYESMSFREAVGVDLAQKSIEAANAGKRDLPIKYLALDKLETLDKDFDYAISTSVLYLIDELAVHAREIFERLKSGGIYFAGYEDYVTDPKFSFTRNAIDKHASVKCANHKFEDVLSAFESAGFNVFIKRIIPTGYIPVPITAKSRWYGTATNEVEYWYEHRYCFRCVKPHV
jgi:SAM-dependent methyltransferase